MQGENFGSESERGSVGGRGGKDQETAPNLTGIGKTATHKKFIVSTTKAAMKKLVLFPNREEGKSADKKVEGRLQRERGVGLQMLSYRPYQLPGGEDLSKSGKRL